MSGLQDIGPLTETLVFVRNNQNLELVVHGITAEGFFYLMQRFPEIRLLMERRGSEITPDRLMMMAAPTIAFVIGCGLVEPDEDMSDKVWQEAVAEQAKRARRLNVSDQLRLITAIFNVTFSEGVSPFVDQLAALMGRPVSPTREEAPGTSSPDKLSAALVVGRQRSQRGAQPRDNSQHGLNS